MKVLPVRSGLVGLLILAGLTATLGIWASMQEANQFLSAGQDGQAQLTDLLDGNLVPGLSADANKAYSSACLMVVPRLDARMLPPDQAELLRAACVDQVGALAKASPVNSFLWFASAKLASQAGDVADLNTSLQLSQASGPNEYWLAVQRVALAEQAFSDLVADTVDAQNQDLTLLATTTPGLRVLAARYVVAPDFRARVTAVLERLPPMNQKSFLENVQEFVKLRGGKL